MRLPHQSRPVRRDPLGREAEGFDPEVSHEQGCRRDTVRPSEGGCPPGYYPERRKGRLVCTPNGW